MKNFRMYGKIFESWTRFFSGKSKIRPVLGGVALNFLELPIEPSNSKGLSIKNFTDNREIMPFKKP